MNLNKIINKTVKIVLPLTLGILLFGYLYRNQNWSEMLTIIKKGVRYDILLFSMIFGLGANVIRGYRWGLLIDSLGKRVRRRNVVFAVLGNYAVNMVLPRIGEIWRCGVTSKYEKISFTKLLGTLLVDRVMDTIVVGIFTMNLFVFNIRFFRNFFAKNPPTIVNTIFQILNSVWTYVSIAFIAAIIWFVFTKFGYNKFIQKIIQLLRNVWEGIKSLWKMKYKWLFIFQTLLIWLGYFLYFYITFFAFDCTRDLDSRLRIGLLAFAMSSIGVAVPVQGGIGVWHFMIISTLVAFGVRESDASTFAFIVFAVQTLWTVLCGLFGIFALPIANKEKLPIDNTHCSLHN